MKFNVVLGNPPYNNDIYLDFVQLGFKLSSQYCLMITPAKWQAKGGVKNELFRETIVPHMSKIVYYPKSNDIFNIALSGGISYYVVDKNEHKDKTVNGAFIKDFDVSLPLDITDTEVSILKKVCKSKMIIAREKFKECKAYFIAIAPSEFSEGYRGAEAGYVDNNSDIILTDCTGKEIHIAKDRVKNINDAYKYKLGLSLHTFENGSYTSHIWKPNYILGRNELILNVGTEDECKSADSFFGSKLIYWLSRRFFGVQTASLASFRFVPDPGPFDHIFTDQELYQKYNITQEEINIIESVIKERKPKN